jgi:hypothetical protein
MKKTVNRRQFLTTLGTGVIASQSIPLYGNDLSETFTNSTFVREAPKD